MNRYTEEELINRLQNFYKKNGIFTRRIYDKSKQRPTSLVITKVFGTWNNALRRAGIPLNKARLSHEEMIKILIKFYEDNNRHITFNQYKNSGIKPNTLTIIKHFGSWNEALLAAKLPIDEKTRNIKIGDIGICSVCNKEFELKKTYQINCSNACSQKKFRNKKSERKRLGLCVKCGSEQINKEIYEDTNIVHWKCRECTYEWEKSIRIKIDKPKKSSLKLNDRYKKEKTDSMPKNRKTLEEYPLIAGEYCTKKNRKSIQNVTALDSKKYWWKCKKCEEAWMDTVPNRINDPNCPYCKGIKQRIDKSKFTNNFNFKTKLIDYPDIIKEWHPAKNDNSPDKFKKDSKNIAWWKCSKCDADWISKIVDRVNKTKKCPTCYPRVFGKVVGDNTKGC